MAGLARQFSSLSTAAQRCVHNGIHDRHPALIVRAASKADAVAVVNYARDAGLDLAVRGGGHSAPGFGTCDGGVVLDLSLINNLFVDPAKKIASGAAPPTTLTTCSTSTRTSPRRADARSASPHRYPIDAPPAAVPAARRNVRRTAATRREAAIQFPWRDAMWPIRRRKRP